ncbi:MAG: (2Fe-2S) ferredoxin domain-containing protein, partial [bacterium]
FCPTLGNRAPGKFRHGSSPFPSSSFHTNGPSAPMNPSPTGTWNAWADGQAPGGVVLEVCQGLACQEVGGGELLSELERLSGRRRGQGGEGVCLAAGICQGRCAIGPNVRVNGSSRSVQGPSEAGALWLRVSTKNKI